MLFPRPFSYPAPHFARTLVLFGLLSACGSDSAPKKSGQAGTSNDVFDQVLSECTEYAGRLCESAAACCNQVTTFVPDDCVTTYVGKVCLPSAQIVAAGLATYDATGADDCLAAHQRAYDTCLANWEEEVTIKLDLWASCHVVDGTVAEGGSCDNDARCAAPPGELATSICVHERCTTVRMLGEGEACPFPNGDVSTCDLGLYCTADAQGAVGTCIRATADGDACDPTFLNLECGLGSYCDLTDAVCKKATNLGGPSCTQDTECVSFHCDRVLQTCSVPITTAGTLCGAP
jgi:hypothetical protein